MQPDSRPFIRRFIRLALLLAAALALGALVVLPARPAAAASIGPGWGPEDNDGLGFVGAFVVDGRQVYCLEPSLPAPLGASTPLGYGGWGSASADDLARANWAISTTGQSPDPRDTVAVNLYVWSLLVPAAYASHGVPGDTWYAAYVPDPADRAEMLTRLAALRASGAAITASPGIGAGTISLSIDPVDEYRGAVTVGALAPANATGVLVLEHAVFDATGTASIAGVVSGAVLPFTAAPPAAPAPYRVGVDGSFSASSVWRAEIGQWSTPDAQTLAGPGRADDLVFPLEATDARDRSVLFQPIVTTEAVDARVAPGHRFADVLRFALAPDANGRINRWFRTPSGYLPVTASCRVYGPFPRQPAPSASPPSGAPLASSFVVTTGAAGPGGEYLAESEHPLPAVGWYSTQCSIDAGSQPAATRPFLPSGYRYEDGFGLVAETALVPFLPTISTSFATPVARAGDRVIDAITIGVGEGPWPLDAHGVPLPIEIEGRFTTVTTRPLRAATAPTDAVEFAVQRLVASAPGVVQSAPVEIPVDAGWVVAQWCVLEGQAVRPVCDDWGADGEVVEIRTLAEPTPTPTPTPRPRLAITGSDGSPIPIGIAAGAVVAGTGVLLQLAARLSARRRRRLGVRSRSRPRGAGAA